MRNACAGFPASDACPNQGRPISAWALHSTREGEKLCDKCFIAYQMDRILGLETKLEKITTTMQAYLKKCGMKEQDIKNMLEIES